VRVGVRHRYDEGFASQESREQKDVQHRGRVRFVPERLGGALGEALNAVLEAAGRPPASVRSDTDRYAPSCVSRDPARARRQQKGPHEAGLSMLRDVVGGLAAQTGGAGVGPRGPLHTRRPYAGAGALAAGRRKREERGPATAP
jgi:hypothetical protein